MEFFSMKVDGLTVASGLEWQALMGIGSAEKEKRSLAEELGSTRFVEMSGATDTLVGFLSPEGAALLPKKAYSLAALLAGVPNISRYCVFIMQDGDAAVMAALRDGLPAPGFDGYDTTENVIATARQFISMAPQAVTVYGNCELLTPAPLTVEDIVKTSKARAKAQIKGLPNNVLKYGILAGLILALGFSANFAYDYHKKQEQLEAEKLAYVNVDAKYLESVSTLLKAAPPAKTTFSMLRDALEHSEVDNNGWALASITCNKSGCTYTWRNDGGTNRSFVAPEGASAPVFTDKGESLSYQLLYSQPLPTGLISATAPALETIRRDVLGQFQEVADLGVSSAFEKIDVFGLPPGLPSAPTKTFKEGAFTVTGPWLAVDALQFLPDVTAFETLEVNISTEQQISFKATGKYYVK